MVIFALPLPAAAYLCHVWRLQTRLLFGSVLLLNGALGYIGFFVWLVWPNAGFAFDVVALGGLLAFWFTPWRKIVTSNDVIITLALIAAVASLYSSALSFAAESHSIYAVPEHRWHLPDDDVLPKGLADAVASMSDPRPISGDWRSSDRPPLQAGIILLQRPFVSPLQWDAISYTLISMGVQLAWIPAMLSILRGLGISRRRSVVSIILIALGAFAYMNSMFVWPKFLAAAYFLFAMLALRRNDEQSAGLERGQLYFVVASLTFGMLSHGGVFFSIVGLAVVAFSALRATPRSVLFSGVVLGLALMSPWVMYQNVYDPPGNRLLKWHLAGVVPVDSRSLGQSLHDQYGRVGFAEALQNKATNFQTLVNNNGFYANPGVVLPVTAHLAATGRTDAFYFFFASPGVLLLGIAGVFFGGFAMFRPGSEGRRIVQIVGVSIVAWCLLMFGPYATVNHQGSYANNLLLIALVVALLHRLPNWASVAVAALAALGFALSFYIPLMQPWPVSSADASSDIVGALCAVALVCFSLWFAWRTVPGTGEVVCL